MIPVTTIRGQANGKPATLEISGDTLTWRATRAGISPGPDNLATTIHDIKDVAWLEKKWSAGGLGLGALAVFWIASEDVVVGAIGLAIAGALVARTFTRPIRRLLILCGDRRLLLDVDADSAATARALAERIRHALLHGDGPLSPPTLP
jgi:hypothetical protein